MTDNIQLDIEKMFNRNQLMPRLKREYQEAPGFVKHIEDNGIPLDFALSLLAEMELCKRAKLEVLVGKLRYHFKSFAEPSQVCADYLYTAAVADLVDWSPIRKEFIVKWQVTQDVRDELERYQYPLPMVQEPREVKTNRDTGYLTITGSIILRDNHHDDDVCLDHINKVNCIPLAINWEVARMIQNQWKGLDKCQPDEDYEEYQKRVRAFEKYDRTAREVMELLDLSAPNGFYLTHKYDKRGRVYPQGYHVNYQGNPWNKAVIEFADGEHVEGF